MLCRDNDTRNAPALGTIPMSADSNVLTRSEAFQPYIRNGRAAVSPISAGIVHEMPAEDIATDAATSENQAVSQPPNIVFTATVLSTSIAFISMTSMQPRSNTFNIAVAAKPITTHLAFTDASTADRQQIFEAIAALYMSSNVPRDRQIADRLTTVQRAALAEDQHILPKSLSQFAYFFLREPELALPKITLTPDGTFRARWIHGPSNFVAIEFTGEPVVKLIAEIPDDNLTAAHFSSVPLKRILSFARSIGASFNR
jgi:hypothetical protein